MMALMERLKAQADENISDEQAGFRNDRNTLYNRDFTLRLIAENQPINQFIEAHDKMCMHPVPQNVITLF